jgi:maltose alpha-D-glucosyltransferase/alpha-amylase
MIDRSDRTWFKNAVIYQAHVKAFQDANGDGIGDFAGLTQRLDYLQQLGVTAIWLLPFYPSPQRDDGYDIAGYRAIHESYGTMRDFRRMVKACHERGLRIVTELVINHTSDTHPWFERARRAKPGSSARNFYVWSDTDKQYADARVIFLDTEKSNWSWDPVAQAYYWHRFYAHQPDLNFDNPQVLRAVISVMRFWLDMGVDGLRLDAIPYLIERDGTNCENLPETHEVIRKIRAVIDEEYPDRVLLAEANQWPEDVAQYFGNGDECHMCFHFPLMPRMYMGIAQEDRHPITDIMRQTPEIPPNCQWGIFLRNHDELTLEMVTSRERDYLWKFYANDPRARINLGIRRRLAPLLENDRRKIELLNSLLFSMPGTPIIYYGDEIGMGDNVYLGDRNGVRTPMQWSPDRNGGFSRADPAKLYLPPIMDPIYGHAAVNVEAQERNFTSLLNWMKRLISMRQQHAALRTGTLRFLYPGNRKILAYLREIDGGEPVLCVANLSHSAQAVELDLSAYKSRVPVELLGRSAFPPIGDLTYLVTLPAYGFHWFVLPQVADVPHWHEDTPPPLPEFMTLVTRAGWRDLMTGKDARQLASEVLPVYLAKQRWFAAKGDRIGDVRFAAMPELPGETDGFQLLQPEVELTQSGTQQRYLLPLAISWSEDAATTNWPLLPYTLAKVRKGPRVGAVYEATATEPFALAILDAMRRGARTESNTGAIVFQPGSGLGEVELPANPEIRRIGGDQSNSSINLADLMVLKLYRRLAPGAHPEAEMMHFLTETAGYANTPKLLGSIEQVDRDGTSWTLGILQQFVRSQGDAWTHALDYLDRVFDGLRMMDAGAEVIPPRERHDSYVEQAKKLARRLAELHRALAVDTEDPAFKAEAITAEDMKAWHEEARQQAESAFEALQAVRGQAGIDQTQVQAVLSRRKQCLDRLASLTRMPVGAMKTRIHGDLHLGQVLVVQADFQIVDFEGEPARSTEARRAKSSPLRDVAGMLRSFDYAAEAALVKFAERDPEAMARLTPFAEEWKQVVRRSFLRSYTKWIAGCPSWPADETEAQRMLNLFMLHKVLYEIGYEAANRPSWLRIPLTGLTATLSAIPKPRERTLAAA